MGIILFFGFSLTSYNMENPLAKKANKNAAIDILWRFDCRLCKFMERYIAYKVFKLSAPYIAEYIHVALSLPL